MAQIIKHRRGSISQLKDVTAKAGELVMATGSINDLNGPFIFIGESENTVGGYRSVSKLYSGNQAPTISSLAYGTVLDGTPYYAVGNETLYILSSGGNTALDLTGNIEGNTISGVTINNLVSTNVSASFFTGSFKGDGSNLTNIPATGVTGLELNQIGQGSVTASITEASGLRINTNTEVTGTLKVTDDVTFEQDLYVSGDIYQTGSFYTQGNIVLSGSINIGNSLTGDTINFGGEVNSDILPTTGATYDLGSSGKTWNNVWAENAHFENISIGDITLNDLSLPGDLTVSGTTTLSGSVLVEDLTEKRLVVVGADGLLTDYNGLTFDNDNLNVSGAIEVTNIQGTGSLYLKADKTDSRYFEIYNTGASDTHIKSNQGLSFFGDDTNYLLINDSAQTATIVGVNGVFVSSSLTVTGSFKLNDGPTNFSIVGNGFSQTYFQGNGALVWNPGYGGMEVVGDNATLKIGNSLNVANGAGITGSLGVSGSLNTSGGASVTGAFTVGSGSITSLGGDVNLTNNNTLYTNYISGYNYGDLNLDAYGDVNIYSNNSHYVEIKSDNDESGSNYLKVQQSGVSLETYDFTSGLTHKVLLDNTGSLKLENVSLSLTGSLGVSGSLDVYGATHIHNDLYVSGNLSILGSGSVVNISSSQVDLGTNIINLNTYAPFERFAGISVYDSGSSAGVTGSLFWDSTNNVWIYANPSGSNYASARFIAGPMNTGSLGEETGLTNGHFPIATGDDHISDSLLTYIGTTLALNTNKFTVDSGTGDTLINGNFTIEGVGGSDNGNYTSYIVFRNDDDVLGFVGTNDTTNVTDRLLGYNSSTGVLEFSSLIDGGTY